MKSVIAFIRSLGYSSEQVSDQNIRRAYWRNAKQRYGIGADPAEMDANQPTPYDP